MIAALARILATASALALSVWMGVNAWWAGEVDAVLARATVRAGAGGERIAYAEVRAIAAQLDGILKAAPNDGLALLRCAEVELLLPDGDPELARSLLLRAERDLPLRARVHFSLLRCAERRGDLAALELRLRAILRCDPTHAEIAWRAMGLILTREGLDARRREAFRSMYAAFAHACVGAFPKRAGEALAGWQALGGGGESEGLPPWFPSSPHARLCGAWYMMTDGEFSAALRVLDGLPPGFEGERVALCRVRCQRALVRAGGIAPAVRSRKR